MKVSIQWTYHTKKKEQIFLTSEFVSIEQALRTTEDMEQTNRVKEILFVDERAVQWTKKELEKLIKEMEKEPHHIIVYFDGGFDKQSKISGLGISIYFDQGGTTYRVRRNERLENLDNNNEAEYAALELSINELMMLSVHHQDIVFRGDSQVVLNQLGGEWPCYEENFKKYLDRIEAKLKKQSIRPVYEIITRKENKEAHQLATQGIVGIDIYSHSPVQ